MPVVCPFVYNTSHPAAKHQTHSRYKLKITWIAKKLYKAHFDVNVSITADVGASESLYVTKEHSSYVLYRYKAAGE